MLTKPKSLSHSIHLGQGVPAALKTYDATEDSG